MYLNFYLYFFKRKSLNFRIFHAKIGKFNKIMRFVSKKCKILTKNQAFLFSQKSLNSIQNKISTNLKLFQAQDLNYPQQNIRQSLQKIIKFNNFVYKNPYIFFSFSNQNPKFLKISQDIENFKKTLSSDLKSDFFLSIKDLFPLYQFFLFSQDSPDIFLEELDKITTQRIRTIDFDHNVELLWLNCLRNKEQLKSKMIDFLINNHNMKSFEKMPKIPLMKTMISQIRLVYGLDKIKSTEDVGIQDSVIIQNMDKIREFIGKKDEMKEFQWVEKLLIPVYNEREKMAYEIINLKETKMEVLLYNKIKKEILREKGIKVKEILADFNEHDILIELEDL